MKTYRFLKSVPLTAVVAVLMSVMIATQSIVSSASAQVAADNTQKLISDIQKEIDRRQTVLNNSTGNTATTTGTATTNANTANCNNKDVPKSVTDGVQKDAGKAGSDLKSLEDSLKGVNNLSGAQQKAKQTDDSYQSFQVAATKSAVVGDLCTQADAKQQLEQLISQAKEKLASNESSSGGSGGGSGNTEEQIAMLEKLVAAVAAIIASVVALIMAIINGDYAAAMALFQTILGQLAVVATILAEALASILEINISLGVSS